MPLVDAATLLPGTGAILVNASGTAAPTLTALNTFASAGTLPSGGWLNIGHTSLDDLPAPGRDGGDVTTLGSWQSKSLRTRQDAVTAYWDVTSIQPMDNLILTLYYGGGDATGTDEFKLPTSSAPQEKAVVIVLNDGGTVGALYEPKMSIIGVDEIGLDAEDFMTVPLRFTHLDVAGTPPKWMHSLLGA